MCECGLEVDTGTGYDDSEDVAEVNQQPFVFQTLNLIKIAIPNSNVLIWLRNWKRHLEAFGLDRDDVSDYANFPGRLWGGYDSPQRHAHPPDKIHHSNAAGGGDEEE